MSTYNPSSGEMEMGAFLGLTGRLAYLSYLANCRVVTAPVSIGWQRWHLKSPKYILTHLYKHEHADTHKRNKMRNISNYTKIKYRTYEWKNHLNLLKGWAQKSNLNIFNMCSLLRFPNSSSASDLIISSLKMTIFFNRVVCAAPEWGPEKDNKLTTVWGGQNIK